MKCRDMPPVAMFTTLHFLHNLQVVPQTTVLVLTTLYNVAPQDIGVTHKLGRNCIVVNATPGDIFTTLHFLTKLCMGQKS
jgi:hypothetical protein